MSLPEPYYDSDGITIFHADCREILPLLEPDSVDLVLTDPPYGVGMRVFDDTFDSVNALNSAPGNIAAVFTSPRRVVELANILNESWAFQRLLSMHKTADMAAPWRGWCMNTESILILSRSGAMWPKQSDYRSDVYSVGPWERAGHPNGKPLFVIRDLARRLSTDTILDPFMGSGTTLRAAKDLGRKAIGIEISEEYCRVAVKRLAQQVLPLDAAS